MNQPDGEIPASDEIGLFEASKKLFIGWPCMGDAGVQTGQHL
jgi:hypothetical protein